MDIPQTLLQKESALRAILQSFASTAVAFSAGVDSTYLLKIAHDVSGSRVFAVTGRTVSTPERELRQAEAVCASLGVRQIVVDIDQLSIPGFADNPPDRCYICKKALFSRFLDVCAREGCAVLIEGTNADDTQDYRPGLRALRELRVRSPLLEAGLTKQEIRTLSHRAGLPTWNKPSLACLATRIPCGETITPEKLAVIDKAEQFLRDNGLGQVRVRLHGRLARIETEPSAMPKLTEPAFRNAVSGTFHALGFDFVTLDLDGYVTGSMNKK